MDEIQERLLDLTRNICSLYCDQVSFDNAIETLGDYGFNNVLPALVKAIYDRLSVEANKFKKRCRDKADKSLFYSTNTKQSEYVNLWSERYSISYARNSPNSTLHQIEVFDTFNDKSMQVTVEKSGSELWKIYPLDENFGLMVEYENETCFISLIFLDFHRHSLQKLDTIQRECESLGIIVNKEEPTEFALVMNINGQRFAETCTVVHTDIVADDLIEITFSPQAYFDKRFYGFQWIENNVNTIKVDVYKLKQQTESHFDVNLPEGYRVDAWDFFTAEWMRNRLFTPIRCLDDLVVIAILDLQTHQWTIIDLSPKNLICQITLFNEKHLIIRTYQSVGKLTNYDFYKISIGKPDLLQNLAWFVLVGYMKRIQHPKGAFEAARRFLPYNSKIRCPFAEPEPDEKKGPREKYIKME